MSELVKWGFVLDDARLLHEEAVSAPVIAKHLLNVAQLRYDEACAAESKKHHGEDK